MTPSQSSDRGWLIRSAIERAMQRIEDLVDGETEALQSRTAIDLRESNNRKSRALLELDMASRELDGLQLDDDFMTRLKRLRDKLETNRTVLAKHLEAVREIAALIADAIQDAEWDGTYSQYAAAGGEAR